MTNHVRTIPTANTNGIHSGDKTHTHGQSICPVSLRAMKRSKRSDVNEIPDLAFSDVFDIGRFKYDPKIRINLSY